MYADRYFKVVIRARILIASQRRRSPAIRSIGVADIESYSQQIARKNIAEKMLRYRRNGRFSATPKKVLQPYNFSTNIAQITL